MIPACQSALQQSNDADVRLPADAVRRYRRSAQRLRKRLLLRESSNDGVDIGLERFVEFAFDLVDPAVE